MNAEGRDLVPREPDVGRELTEAERRTWIREVDTSGGREGLEEWERQHELLTYLGAEARKSERRNALLDRFARWLAPKLFGPALPPVVRDPDGRWTVEECWGWLDEEAEAHRWHERAIGPRGDFAYRKARRDAGLSEQPSLQITAGPRLHRRMKWAGHPEDVAERAASLAQVRAEIAAERERRALGYGSLDALMDIRMVTPEKVHLMPHEREADDE